MKLPKYLESIEKGKNVNGSDIVGAFSKNLLEKISFPDSLKATGSYAFHGNRIKEISFGNIEVIEHASFSGNQLETLKIPKTIKKIGSQSFENNKLTKVYLNNGLQDIDNYAFWKNYLQEITIPETVQTLGEGSFTNNSLTSLNISEKLETLINSNPKILGTDYDFITGVFNSYYSTVIINYY